MKTSQLELFDAAGSVVPNTLFSPESAKATAVVFPGADYTCDRPVLYYITELLLARSIATLLVEWNYSKDELYRSAVGIEKQLRARRDAEALAPNLGTFLTSTRTSFLVGFSAGTHAVLGLLDSGKISTEVHTLWLSPSALLDWERAVSAAPKTSLWIYGTADRNIAPEQCERAPGDKIPLAGAGHSLEVDGDLRASLRILGTIVDEAAGWLDRRLAH